MRLPLVRGGADRSRRVLLANRARAGLQFPEDVQGLLKELDAQGDGRLDGEEFLALIRQSVALRDLQSDGQISLQALPKELQPALKLSAAPPRCGPHRY